MNHRSLALLLAPLVLLPVAPPLSASPPPAPEGYRWVPDPRFTDEFDGPDLDASKWHDHHPRWQGRPPAKFMPSALSVKDGLLQIRNSVLTPPQGRFSIAGGAVVSKSTDAHFGYYEVRFTLRPDTEYHPTPFEQPMHLNLVTETYDWETPPTPEELNDDSINTTYYDWVRGYVLEAEEN